MPRNNSRSRNNNPTGRNQYSSDWMDTVKDRPIAAAAVAAASVGAGVFLWSKRSRISDQLSSLSDQISDWRDSMRSGDENELETASADSSPSGAATGSTSSRTSRSTGSRPTSTKASGRGRTNRGMSETGGGNASLGRQTGSGAGAESM
ncbi:MAG TPA: hypothetical protein VFO41_14765 [Alphaproteobacteria bacterium]|nr:hypothetical protein [Alphaproteobacteria bacterium]